MGSKERFFMLRNRNPSNTEAQVLTLARRHKQAHNTIELRRRRTKRFVSGWTKHAAREKDHMKNREQNYWLVTARKEREHAHHVHAKARNGTVSWQQVRGRDANIRKPNRVLSRKK